MCGIRRFRLNWNEWVSGRVLGGSKEETESELRLCQEGVKRMCDVCLLGKEDQRLVVVRLSLVSDITQGVSMSFGLIKGFYMLFSIM